MTTSPYSRTLFKDRAADYERYFDNRVQKWGRRQNRKELGIWLSLDPCSRDTFLRFLCDRFPRIALDFFLDRLLGRFEHVARLGMEAKEAEHLR